MLGERQAMSHAEGKAKENSEEHISCLKILECYPRWINFLPPAVFRRNHDQCGGLSLEFYWDKTLGQEECFLSHLNRQKIYQLWTCSSKCGPRTSTWTQGSHEKNRAGSQGPAGILNQDLQFKRYPGKRKHIQTGLKYWFGLPAGRARALLLWREIRGWDPHSGVCRELQHWKGISERLLRIKYSIRGTSWWCSG